MSKLDSIKVTVVIPTYNAEPYIVQALQSVLHQTEQNLEIIVCDDQSTDNTVAVVNEMASTDCRIKLLTNNQNQGPSYSRNRAISEAKGDWIAILDADDFYHKDRLKELIEIGEECNADLVADNIYYVNKNGKNPRLAINSKKNSKKHELISTNSFIQCDLPGASSFKYGFLKPIIRKNFLCTHKITYDETTRLGEDFILYVECLLNGATFVFSKNIAFYYYRIVANSITRTYGKKSYLELRNNNSKLINIAKNKGNKEAIRLLQHRHKLYNHIVLYSEIYNQLQSHQVFTPLMNLIVHPESWFFCFKMALDFIRRKIKNGYK